MEKPDFESSGSKEERHAGDARAGTPPHQVPGGGQGTGRPGVRTRLGGNVVTRSPPHPPTGDYRAGRRRLGEGTRMTRKTAWEIS